MKALSIKQPWAWLICAGWKPVENRNWHTRFRGRVLIHASKTFDQAGYDWVTANAERLSIDLLLLPRPYVFDRGGLVGASTVIDCVDEMDSPWFVGEYGIVMENSVPIPTIPLRGQLGFFDVPEAVVQMAREAWKRAEQARLAVRTLET